MSVNLITGYAGEAHVTSQDDGAVNAGVIGNGKYVFNIGEKFAYETISNNLIRIKDGYMINQGRKIGIKVNDYEDVTIDNGLQSVKRSDLIVMRYTKNADTGIEIAEVVVIKGTSGDSYVDPEHTTGDILNGDLIDDVLLYRVNLDGLNITSVTALFTVSNTVKELETDINTNKTNIANNVSELGLKADESKNLLPNNWHTQTINGITFTVNNDSSITINNTVESITDVTFYLYGEPSTRKKIDELKIGQSYRISCCPLNESHEYPGYRMNIDYTSGGTGHLGIDNGTVDFMHTYVGDEEWIFSITVFAREKLSNVTFYPMIRKAEITDSTYEQYYPTLKEVGTKLGTTDISAIADGTVTGGISTLNSANNTFHSVTSTNGTVVGGYVLVGKVVTVSIKVTLTSAIVANSSNIIDGLPSPAITFSPLSGLDSSTNNLTIIPYVSSTHMRVGTNIPNDTKLEISGSYIKA